MLGFVYVGFLGVVRRPDPRRSPTAVGILLGAVLATVANDVGALLVGRQFGRRPLAPDISPNKTVEGLVGGALAVGRRSASWSSASIGLAPVGRRRGPLARRSSSPSWRPLGDLCESMIKRDLGVKDMGKRPARPRRRARPLRRPALRAPGHLLPRAACSMSGPDVP